MVHGYPLYPEGIWNCRYQPKFISEGKFDNIDGKPESLNLKLRRTAKTSPNPVTQNMRNDFALAQVIKQVSYTKEPVPVLAPESDRPEF